MRESPNSRGWREQLRAVGVAVGELLALGTQPRPVPLSNPVRALAARDRVVAGLRALLAAAGHAPGADDGPITLADLTARPGVALHAALDLLPPAAPADRPAPSDLPPRPLTAYERAWDYAARCLLALEPRLDTLPHPPSPAADALLADIADLASTLEVLDTDLLAALPASTTRGLDEAGPALSDRAGHTAVRVTATECRLRCALPGPANPDRFGATDPFAFQQHRLQHRAVGLSGLGGATQAVTELLARRGQQLSAVELRAVAGLLESGAAHAASTLRRAAPALPAVGQVAEELLALPAAGQVAEQLLALPPAAEALRRSPLRSLSPPDRALPLLTGQIRGQLARLAALSTRLPATTPGEDLHRLARPALAWAAQVAPLTDALSTAVRETLAAGLLAVPVDVTVRGRSVLLWAPASASPEPPRVLTRVTELHAAAQRLPPVVHAVTLPAASRPAVTAPRSTRGTAVRAAAGNAGQPPDKRAAATTGRPGSAAELPSRATARPSHAAGPHGPPRAR